MMTGDNVRPAKRKLSRLIKTPDRNSEKTAVRRFFFIRPIWRVARRYGGRAPQPLFLPPAPDSAKRTFVPMRQWNECANLVRPSRAADDRACRVLASLRHHGLALALVEAAVDLAERCLVMLFHAVVHAITQFNGRCRTYTRIISEFFVISFHESRNVLTLGRSETPRDLHNDRSEGYSEQLAISRWRPDPSIEVGHR